MYYKIKYRYNTRNIKERGTGKKDKHIFVHFLARYFSLHLREFADIRKSGPLPIRSVMKIITARRVLATLAGQWRKVYSTEHVHTKDHIK